jgi:Tfp pilus assembly protein PilF
MSEKQKPEETPEVVAPEMVDAPLWKLALGTILTPKDAFEEICRRRLLAPGLVITAILGFAFMAATFFAHYAGGGGTLYALGANNPVVLIGGMTLTAMLFQWIAVKFSRAEGTFVDTICVLAWANVVVLLFFVAGLIPKAAPLSMAAPLLGVIIAIMGLKAVHKMTGLNATASYLLAAIVTVGIAAFAPNIVALRLGQAYVQAAHPYVPVELSFQVTSLPVQLAGACVAVLGLVFAAAFWLKLTKGEFASLRGVFAGLAAIGVVGMIAFTGYVVANDPIKPLDAGIAAYDRTENPDPALAARKFGQVLKDYPTDYLVQLYRAHALAASGQYGAAEKDYKFFSKSAGWLYGMSIGSIKLFQGDYKAADSEFTKVLKSQPTYAEAQARLALTKLRLGKDKDAEKLAVDALDNKFKGYLPYLILAEVYTRSGDKKQAKKNIDAVEEYDEALAKRIESASGGWAKAAEVLTPVDLRMPLELPRIVPEKAGTKRK